MMVTAEDEWPDALVLLGDQVYADETSESTQPADPRSAATSPTRRATRSRDFEEYTWLYDESWTDPQVRWLLSTVPSSMIFDDHDLRDDWNTSDVLAPRDAGDVVVAGADHRRAVVVLGLPAPGQPLPGRAGRGRRSTSGSAPTTVTPSRCCASSPRRPTGRRTAHKGARWSYRRDFGPVAAAGDRLPLRADPGQRRPQHAQRGRVRLDRGAARRRLRPPADRHLAALAAAPRVPRPRGLERAALRRAPRPPAGRLRREAAPRQRISSTGRRSGTPSTGWPS